MGSSLHQGTTLAFDRTQFVRTHLELVTQNPGVSKQRPILVLASQELGAGEGHPAERPGHPAGCRAAVGDAEVPGGPTADSWAG